MIRSRALSLLLSASVVVTGARSTDAVLDLPFDLEVLSRERR